MIDFMARKKEFDPDHVVNMAIQIFWDKGYESTSMQDLVDFLGIGRGSFYDTFSSKHNLFLLALKQYSREKLQELKNLLETMKLEEAMMCIFYGQIEESLSDQQARGCFLTNTTAELAQRDKDVSEVLLTHRNRCIELLQNAFDSIHSQEDAYRFSLFVMNSLDGMKVLSRENPSRNELVELVDFILGVLLKKDH